MAAPHSHGKTDAWHAQEADQALLAVTSSETGLTNQEAATRLSQYGPNRLTQVQKRTLLQRFLSQFHNVLIYVLIASAFITAWLEHWVDSGVILGVVILNAIIGFIQEGKAEKALEAIRSMLSQQASVRRAGEMVSLAADQLVLGDIVLLQSGDKVPADLRLIDVKQLRIDEALLTGESVPVDKTTQAVAATALLGDRFCMAYSGTMVTYGQGVGVVVATGDNTEVGHIGTMLGHVDTLATPLVKKMAILAEKLTVVILILAALTFVFGLSMHAYTVAEMFLAAVGLIVAAIPEGLPAIMTITLAIGVQMMAKRNAIIRRLPVVEALGSVTVICTDKTGTLTRNEMTVRTILMPQRELHVSGVGYDPHGEFSLDGQRLAIEQDAQLMELVRGVALCNDARVFLSAQQTWEMVGDPTEGALCTLALKAGLDRELQLSQCPRTDVIPFESEHKFMATLHHDHAGHGFIYLKGAPERILEMCTHQREQGQDVLINHAQWHRRMDDVASHGQRLLAVAFKRANEHQRDLQFSDVESGLTLLGVVGIIDPPRQEAIEAVARCQAAGIRVVMITGDHAITAGAIAQSLGMADNGHVITGQQLDQLDDMAFERRVGNVSVFARTTPEHKLKLVQALQAQGHVVAMTGDGVNDAPALKRADVGIAMGKKGTEVSKEAAEVVLADDNFASIYSAVEEGRTVFDNIKKAILYTLPTSVGEALTIMAAIIFGISLPITPVQILWVNMITAVTLALALAFEPAEQDVMKRLPRDPAAPILSRHLMWRIAFVALILLAGTFGLYYYNLAQGASLEYARTVAVNTLVMFEVFYLFNARHILLSSCSFSDVLKNRYVCLAISVLLFFQLLFTYASPVQQIFGTVALQANTWLGIIVVASMVFFLVELEKWLLRRKGLSSL